MLFRSDSYRSIESKKEKNQISYSIERDCKRVIFKRNPNILYESIFCDYVNNNKSSNTINNSNVTNKTIMKSTNLTKLNVQPIQSKKKTNFIDCLVLDKFNKVFNNVVGSHINKKIGDKKKQKNSSICKCK